MQELIRKGAVEATVRANKAAKQIYDKRHRDANFDLVELMMVYFEPRASRGSVKFVEKFVGPYKISLRKPHDIYVLEYVGTERKRQKRITAHVSRIKKFYAQTERQSPELTINDLNLNDKPLNEEFELIDKAPDNQAQDNNMTSGDWSAHQSEPIIQRPNKRKQTLTTKQVFLVNVALMIIGVLSTAAITNGEHCNFQSTNTMVLTETEYPVVTGSVLYQMAFKVKSPCHELFTDLTTTQSLNAKLIDSCYETYVERIEKPLSGFCGNNSLSRSKRFVGDVVAIGISSASLVVALDVKLNDIPYLEGSVNQLREETTAANKRFDSLADNVSLMKSTMVNDREATQYYLKTLSDRISLLRKEAEMNTAAAMMLAFYLEKVDTMANDIATSASEWRYNKKVIFNLFNLMGVQEKYNSIISRFGKTTHCSCENETLPLGFKTHKIDEKTTIFKTNAFKHYVGRSESICLREWQGPSFVLYNSTAKCHKTLTVDDIGVVHTVRTSCEVAQELPTYDKLWRTAYCTNSSENKVASQIWSVNSDGFNHIYCQTQTISFPGKGTCACPNFVFRIPDDDPFQVDGYKYTVYTNLITSYGNFKTVASSKILFQLASSEEPLSLDRYERGKESIEKVTDTAKSSNIKWLGTYRSHRP